MTMGLPEGDTKEPALRSVTDLLEREGVPYAVIGGLALQLHSEEPRTTRDIDLAVKKYDDVPASQLRAAGFEHVGRFAHSDNWIAPGPGPKEGRTPVQFSADEEMAGAIERATSLSVGDLRLRLVTASDLVALKLRAAEDPSRRASKRATDVADILRLVEDHPELRGDLPDLTRRLARIQQQILGLDRGR
jgi:predicted nucleotidyltransferase